MVAKEVTSWAPSKASEVVLVFMRFGHRVLSVRCVHLAVAMRSTSVIVLAYSLTIMHGPRRLANKQSCVCM